MVEFITRQNLLCILRLFHGVGLQALRALFLEINPTWSNQRSDAARFDKGSIKFYDETQEEIFNSGNIDEWDFSLISSVLLYSNRCFREMRRRRGYKDALHKLKRDRNELLVHITTDRMSDDDFSRYWPRLSANFITLGADPDKVKELERKTDEGIVAGNYYKELFMIEREKNNRCEKKLDFVIGNLSHGTSNPPAVSDIPAGSLWDEWLHFHFAVDDFNTLKNQYILVTDSLPHQDLECYSMLRRVAWKIILDFDPMSEEKGFYQKFMLDEGQSTLVSMFTPKELSESTIKSLWQKICTNETKWMFVNGRSADIDGGNKESTDREGFSLKGINRFLVCCSDSYTFDQLKPVICIILPFRDKNLPKLEDILSRLTENLSSLNLKFVAVGNNNWQRSTSEKFNVQGFNLSSKILYCGFEEVLGTSVDRRLCLPTSHDGVPVNLSSRQYLYIKEHLEVLYKGCEDLPKDAETQQQEKFLEEQRMSFLSGNQISFASLHDNHDAKRKLEKDIQIHVQRLLDQGLTKPVIVEIRHLPGTGGTTIARRVLWDLHEHFPCAVIDISYHCFSDEDNTFANNIAERIASLEEICNTTPLILIDGKQSGVIEVLSNKVSRILQNKGKRVLLLRCLRGSIASSKKTPDPSQVHKVFHVNINLEASRTDLHEFEAKYNETIEKSLGTKNRLSGLCRVFHFPLLAMMEEFRPKLEMIIEDTFNELNDIQKDIAEVVAFLQKYTNLSTPALLLHEAFKKFIIVSETKSATYEDIRQLFSESLLNLMIPTKPTRQEWQNPPTCYTFQHPVVADLILKRVFLLRKHDLFGIMDKFLQFPIYQQEMLLPLIFELFVYNKKGETELKFSILFEELKEIDSDRAAEMFCRAAEKLNDPVMFAHAARFYARKEPPLFERAKKLIKHALKVHESTSKGKYINLRHTEGVVLYFEFKNMIKSGEIKNLEDLEVMASKVLEAHREARNFPPTFPHPLIGEVEVWSECINWILNKRCNRDTEETLAFLTNLAPLFFRDCLSNCFYLLDTVDGIVQSVQNLSDPEKTKRLCNELRTSLMMMCPTKYFKVAGRRNADEDIVQACKAICTSKYFSNSSQKELKRLQAHFILTWSESIDNLKKQSLEYLFKLLEDLVLKESDYRFAQHLMKVCMLVPGPRCYSLEQGLNVCEKWLEASSHGCLPEFYQMAIYFLQILDGHSLEFGANYIQALEKCREKSQHDLRRFAHTHFVGNKGHGISRLISRSTLLSRESDYDSEDAEKLSRFWRIGSRKKLLECKGRIKVKQSSGRLVKSQPYIELLQGNLEIYVGKHAGIGKVGQDFPQDSLAYFVVSFNLQGPVANGIMFSPHNPSFQ